VKTYLFKVSCLLFILTCNYPSFGQNTSDSVEQNKINNPSYVSIDVNFMNDAVYLGRKDSISAPYLYPSITYFNKTGLYVTGSLSYLTKSNQSRIDLILGTIGYEINSKNFSGDISFTKYFFNVDSYNVISEVEEDLTATLGYDFDIFNLNLSISVINFLKKESNSDVFLSSEISRDFVSTNGKFQISPTIGIFFGSQNFYKEYYINNRFGSERSTGSGQGSGQGSGGTVITGGTVETTTTTVVHEESEKFDLMAIEFSVPIWYVAKPFIVSFLPVLVVPQNPVTLTIDSTIYEEDLENTFYWMVGLSYRF
jgi:hypothetical protein